MKEAWSRNRPLCLLLLLWPLLTPGPAVGADEKQVDAAAKQLLAANGFFQRQVYDLAAREYSGFLARYPKHKETTSARYGLAICRYRLSQYADAVKEMVAVLKDRRFEQRDEALAVLGYCYLATEANDKALATFDEILRKHPKSKHVEFAGVSRLQALYLLGKTKETADAARAFVKAHPASVHRPTVEYYLALSLSGLGEHAEVAAILTDLLKKRPNSPHVVDATLLLGQSLENQGKLDAAAEQYRRMIRIGPTPRHAEGHYSLGLVLYKAGKYGDSIKELTAVLTKFPASRYAAPAKLQLGLAQLAAAKVPDARKTLSQVVKADASRAVSARYWLAQCDMAEKKYAPARAALDALAKTNPPPANLPAVLFDRAVCAAALEKHDQAAAEFAAFCKAHPKSELLGDAMYRQAFSLHKLGKYAESLALCKPVAAGPSAAAGPAAELAAENLFLLGNYADAAVEFERLGKAAKDQDAGLRFQLRRGQCAYFQGDFAKTVELLKGMTGDPKVLKNPALQEAVFLVGDAQLQAKQYTAAAAALTKYVSLGTARKPEAQYKLGLAQARGGDLAGAKRTLAAVMRGPPASPWVVRATFESAQILYDGKHPDQAAPLLQKVLAAKPPADIAASATYLLAWIDLDAGKHDAAAKRFGDLAKRHAAHPLAADSTFRAGMCLKEAGKLPDALNTLEGYLKAYPEAEHRREADELIGICLSALGKHDAAVKRLSKLAADKKTCTDTVLYELAWAHRELKQPDPAMKTYQRLLAEFPRSKLLTAARAELAELLDIQKQYAEAAALLEQVVADSAADPKTLAVSLYRLGLCYGHLDKHAEAAAAFSRLAAKYPKDENVPSALYRAGVAFAEVGKLPEAQKQFSALLAKHPKSEPDAAARLKLGEVQAAARDYARSAATYTAFLQKYPTSEYAYLAKFGIGWAMENGKKYDDARKWYTQVIETHNGPTAARAQFQIGECYFAQGKFDLAAGELMKVDIVYAYPEWSAPALYDAGRAFEQLQQPDQAKKQYALCIRKYKDSGPAALAAKRLQALQRAKP